MDVGKTIAWTVGMPLAEARSSSASRTIPTGYPLSIMAVPRAAIESSTTGLETVSVVTVAVPISGAGAGRRRISHQMNSPAASSTPTAMSRVGRVVVDVAIAGGTAGTGVAVDGRRGQGCGCGCGCGSRRQRRNGGRGLCGCGVGNGRRRRGGCRGSRIDRRGGGARRLVRRVRGRRRCRCSHWLSLDVLRHGACRPRGAEQDQTGDHCHGAGQTGQAVVRLRSAHVFSPFPIATTRRSPSRGASD